MQFEDVSHVGPPKWQRWPLLLQAVCPQSDRLAQANRPHRCQTPKSSHRNSESRYRYVEISTSVSNPNPVRPLLSSDRPQRGLLKLSRRLIEPWQIDRAKVARCYPATRAGAVDSRRGEGRAHQA